MTVGSYSLIQASFDSAHEERPRMRLFIQILGHNVTPLRAPFGDAFILVPGWDVERILFNGLVGGLERLECCHQMLAIFQSEARHTRREIHVVRPRDALVISAPLLRAPEMAFVNVFFHTLPRQKALGHIAADSLGFH